MENKELSPIEELIKIIKTDYDWHVEYSPPYGVIPTLLKKIEPLLAKEQSRESTYKKQIEELQSQLAEKDKEIRANRLMLKQWDSDYKNIEAVNEELQSELTELKEKHKYDENDMLQAAKYGYVFRDTTSFPEHKFEDSCINNTKQWLIYYKETHKTK